MESLSEQLGAYDFFCVLGAGGIFWSGMCAIIPQIYVQYADVKGDRISKYALVLILFYVTGMVLQELGAIVDTLFLRVKDHHYNSLLYYNGRCPTNYNKKKPIKLIKQWFKKLIDRIKNLHKVRIASNPMTYLSYLEIGNAIINQLNDGGTKTVCKNKLKKLNDKILKSSINYDQIGRYIFLRCEYSVAWQGKNKKFERMRAIFGFSRSLLICFFLLFIIVIIKKNSPHINSISTEYLAFIFLLLTYIFYLKANKSIRYMILIIMGHYEAFFRDK